jgi:hypothetical protein
MHITLQSSNDLGEDVDVVMRLEEEKSSKTSAGGDGETGHLGGSTGAGGGTTTAGGGGEAGRSCGGKAVGGRLESTASRRTEVLLVVKDVRADKMTYAAEARADEADSASDERAPLSDEATPEASLAALPVNELKTVLKPVVVVITLPAESVTVARRGRVVMALWAPPVTEAPAEARASEALATAEVRMGMAAGVD